MQSDSRKPRLHRPRSGKSVAAISKIPIRKIPCRVGYHWNKGGRLRELRIRHLARKFLKIWMQNTFGHILPHEARIHYARVVVRKTFEGWRDEWWTSRRGWDLTVRAECHYRYYLCHLIVCHWRAFVVKQREKRQKIQKAQSFADRRSMCRVWEKWEVFTEIKRIKNRMLEHAVEQNKQSILRSAWSLWQTRLQQQRKNSVMEDQALRHRALYLQRWAWLQWKCRREKESKASNHFIFTLKRKSLHQWISCCQNKKKSQAVAQRAFCPHRMKTFRREWNSEKERLQLSRRLAVRNSKRGALQRWRAHMSLCREEAEREQVASRHHHLHLMRVGLRVLYLNVTRNKEHRLNNNMALQHYRQTMIRKYWKLWEDRLEETHDRIVEERKWQVSDRRSREQQACRQGDLCSMRWAVDKWRKFVLSRRMTKSRLDQVQQYHEDKLVRDTFGAQKKYHIQISQVYDHADELYKEQIQCLLRKVLSQWQENAALLVDVRLSEQKAEYYFQHFLQVKVFLAWRQTTHAVSRHRQQREAPGSTQSATNQGMLPRQSGNQSGEAQRDRMCMEKAQKHYNSKLLSKALQAWKKHHCHYHKYKVMKRQGIMLLRLKMYQRYFEQWKEKLQHRRRESTQTVEALWHWALTLQAKVLHAWRLWVVEQHRKRACRDQLLATTSTLLCAARERHPTTTQHSQELRSQHVDRVVRRCALSWKQRTLLKPRSEHAREQPLKEKVAFRLPGPETVSSSDPWQQEAEDGMHSELPSTPSLRRQPRRRAEQLEPPSSAQKHNSTQRFSEAAAQISELSGSLIGHHATPVHLTSTQQSANIPATSSSEPPTMVRRCALSWKQRALLNPRSEHAREHAREQPLKKKVPFRLPGPETVSSSDPWQQEAEDGMHSELPSTPSLRRQPRRRAEQLEPPSSAQKHNSTQRFSEAAAQISKLSGSLISHHATPVHLTSTQQSANIPATSSSEPPTMDLLLGPSAFMSTETQMKFRRTSSSTLRDASAVVRPTFTDQEMNQTVSRVDVKDKETDPLSSLGGELLSIKEEMEAFVVDKKQVELWRQMKDVFQSWLDTSGKEHEERNSVCQDLKELDEDIQRLSTDLATRRPLMMFHVERIQRLRSAFISTGAYSSSAVRGDGQQTLLLQDVSSSSTSTSKPHASVLDSSQMTPSQDLLPPSAFMSTETQEKFGRISCSGPRDASAGIFRNYSSTHQEINRTVSSKEAEDTATDPSPSLKRELLSIKEEMETFLADKTQIELWQQMKAVFQTWLDTSGKEHEGRNAVYQELKELDKHIQRLSADLATQKPLMLLHAERIQRLRSAFISSGAYSPSAVRGDGQQSLSLQDVSSSSTSASNPYTSALDSSQMTPSQDLLPPSVFMSTETQEMIVTSGQEHRKGRLWAKSSKS